MDGNKTSVAETPDRVSHMAALSHFRTLQQLHEHWTLSTLRSVPLISTARSLEPSCPTWLPAAFAAAEHLLYEQSLQNFFRVYTQPAAAAHANMTPAAHQRMYWCC
jgi:hypothetical protein